MLSANKSTKRVAVVVSKQQKKKNKSRLNTRKGSSKVKQESVFYAPTAQTRVTTTDNRSGKFIVPRREFLGTLTSTSSAFTIVKTVIINPGDVNFSPWGSNIARCYESYRFRRLKFVYVPRCSTLTGGTVAFSPDCNPKDTAPISDIIMYGNQKTKSTSPWAPMEIIFDRNMLQKRSSYFNRPLAPNGDKDLYDVGNLYIAIEGVNSGEVVGQLWVDYEVEFMTPEGVSSSSETFIAGGGAGVLNSASPIPLFNGVNTANANQVGNTIQTVTNDGTQSLIRFAKDFHGMLNMQSQGIGLTSPTVLTNIGGVLLNQVDPEVTWNGNQTITNAGNTSTTINSLISATAGAVLGVKNLLGSTTSNVAFSLTPCGL